MLTKLDFGLRQTLGQGISATVAVVYSGSDIQVIRSSEECREQILIAGFVDRKGP